MLICLLAISPGLVALPVEDLYVAEVLVPSRDAGDLRRGAQTGLRNVLVRASGSTDLESPAIRAALLRPEDYYYQYGYESTDENIATGDGEASAWRLRLAFEPSAIARLLREAGLPVWGSNRPAVLAWIAISENGTRRVLAEGDEGPLRESLDEEARYRGLPLLYPILDLEDAATLSEAEVWGGFLERIDVASIRYSPDVILNGRVQQDATGQWQGRWYFRLEDRWLSLENSGLDRDVLVREVIGYLADDLASRFAIDSSRNSLMLRVEAVDSLDDYAALTSYLASLAPVLDTLVVEVTGDEVLFRVDAEGQFEQLQQLIELDEKLLLMGPGASQPGAHDAPVLYRWMEQ